MKCTSVPPSGTRGDCAYDVPVARAAHWCRGGSTASSLCRNEAQTLGFPVPTPVTSSNCWIHELDHWSTAWSRLKRWLSLRSDAKMDPSTLDDDRLSPFCCVEEKRKLLSGFGGRVAFHIVQCTIPAILKEAPSSHNLSTPKSSEKRFYWNHFYTVVDVSWFSLCADNNFSSQNVREVEHEKS